MTIIELDTIDSTNKYAMQLIDADKARHGLTITARSQTGGKGQRGRTWIDRPGESLLMSLIAVPTVSIRQQPSFNATVAVAIANILQKLNTNWKINIKWPNDIIVNDKKAGGILIENVLRGSNWSYSVIGLGLNIRQNEFPADLPYATSLKMASGKEYDVSEIRMLLQQSILDGLAAYTTPEYAMKEYDEYLYRKGKQQAFSDESGIWSAEILHAEPDGSLAVLKNDGSVAHYYHGQVNWEWGK